jgi:Txe/YoeB family toxin of Txe-Axe toxin-antitoxin module
MLHRCCLFPNRKSAQAGRCLKESFNDRKKMQRIKAIIGNIEKTLFIGVARPEALKY